MRNATFIIAVIFAAALIGIGMGENESEQLSQQPIPAMAIRWGDLSARLAETGVLDVEKLETTYSRRGGLTGEARALLSGGTESLVLTEENADVALLLLWALGLGTKNDILESGPMTDPRFGDPSRFASTGGWTLANGSAMDHYAKHDFLTLTAAQQDLVERIAKTIYRPCCDNSTYFPDCNHGMAMLGLLELMAAHGATEEEIYREALRANVLWFPDAYMTIAQYLREQGRSLNSADPKEILGSAYSSATGYQQILAQTRVLPSGGGGGCGV